MPVYGEWSYTVAGNLTVKLTIQWFEHQNDVTPKLTETKTFSTLSGDTDQTIRAWLQKRAQEVMAAIPVFSQITTNDGWVYTNKDAKVLFT